MLFPASSGSLRNTAIVLGATYTIVVVEMPTSSSGQNNERTIQSLATNSLISASRSTAAGNNAYVSGTVSNYRTNDTNTHTLILRSDSSSKSYLVDGTEQASSTSGGTGAWGTGIALGAGNSPYTSEYGYTTIKAIMIFPTKLTDTQCANIRTYCQSNYGAV